MEARVYQGREQVLSFFENYLDTFEAVVIQPDRFIESGDWVVVPNTTHYAGGGTASKPSLGAPSPSSFTNRRSFTFSQFSQEALEAAGLRE